MNVNTPCILQVEDDENDVLLLELVFKKAGLECPLRVVEDGQKAIDYLSGAGAYADREKFPLPCLVLLDLNLPVRSGLEVLAWIRQHAVFKKLVVVVFSASALQVDVERACLLGANSFITKPRGFEKTLEIAQLLKGWWLGYNQFAPIEAGPPIAGTRLLPDEAPSRHSASLEPAGSPMSGATAGQTG
jgi:CheY-like chemotaxis protein